MAEIRQKKLHAIMISVPFQGHINPFVNIALKLASKGFTITFVHIAHAHQKLSKAGHNNNDDLFFEARELGFDIRYTTIEDGYSLEMDRDSDFEKYWDNLFHEFPAIVDDFVGKIIESDPYLVPFLVADTFYSWPAAIAEKYKLVNVSLWTEPALVFSLGYHWDLLEEMGHIPRKDDDEDEDINYIPGVESISTKDLMSFLTDANSVVRKPNFAAFKEVKKADFILHNMVHELESHTFSTLSNYQPNYAIGPINFYKNLPTNNISKSLLPESDCTHWLASKPPGSVLYVSFGSYVQTSKQVIEEIGYGLLHSEVDFIWAVRSGIVGFDDTNVLPVGFEDEVKDKGLIVPWCDQSRILSDPAVGGFLTHNGWNSTIESMWCGVPMICYPIAYDQLTNRKLVVDDWKIGINLCDGKTIEWKEVAEKIKYFMNGTTSKRFRDEANNVKEILHNALEIDGSSERNFDQFVNDLKEKICAPIC